MRFGRQSALTVAVAAAAAAAKAAPVATTACGGGGGGIVEGLFHLHNADDYILHGWTALLLPSQVLSFCLVAKCAVVLLFLFICE
jgi:hypothetical protein